MKRCLLLTLFLLLFAAGAAAETLGFGFVNAKDVALRREPGGKTLVRVPQDTCVWISDSRVDSKGTLWYQINTGLHIEHANYDYYGWMMADFIDCGDVVWHDVTSVSCSPHSNGMMALFADGSALTASRPIVSADGSKWVPARRMTAPLEPLQQVLVASGLNFYSVDQAGEAHVCARPAGLDTTRRFRIISGIDGRMAGITPDNQLRGAGMTGDAELTWFYPAQAPDAQVLDCVTTLSGSIDWLLMLTDSGELMAVQFAANFMPEDHPAWADWQGLTSIDSGYWCQSDQQTYRGTLFAAVTAAGEPLIHPAELQSAVADWHDLADIQVGKDFLLGLRRDGTAVTISTDGRPAPDVSAWQDIAAIEASTTYCVGLKRDGTLVFAGDITFIGEGHTRR